jgi:predicted nucleic acid-binding Zn finger protein
MDADLILRIDGRTYQVEPIDPTAFRLVTDKGDVYDVATLADGPFCDCPDAAYRRNGNDQRGCKHYRALRAVGLLPAPSAILN